MIFCLFSKFYFEYGSGLFFVYANHDDHAAISQDRDISRFKAFKLPVINSKRDWW